MGRWLNSLNGWMEGWRKEERYGQNKMILECMVNRDERREWGKIKEGVEKRGRSESE